VAPFRTGAQSLVQKPGVRSGACSTTTNGRRRRPRPGGETLICTAGRHGQGSGLGRLDPRSRLTPGPTTRDARCQPRQIAIYFGPARGLRTIRRSRQMTSRTNGQPERCSDIGASTSWPVFFGVVDQSRRRIPGCGDPGCGRGASMRFSQGWVVIPRPESRHPGAAKSMESETASTAVGNWFQRSDWTFTDQTTSGASGAHRGPGRTPAATWGDPQSPCAPNPSIKPTRRPDIGLRPPTVPRSLLRIRAGVHPLCSNCGHRRRHPQRLDVLFLQHRQAPTR